jgi:hypothetical protein
MKNLHIQKMILALIMILPVLCSGQISSKPEIASKEVMEAYNLRLNGKCDDAMALLQTVIEKDSANAMAYYELARLQQYMLTGGGKVKIADIVNSADKAVANAPGNVIYVYYKALTSFLNAFFAMQGDQQQVKLRIEQTCKYLERVLELKPDYSEAAMYLVEIYGMLPREMGGDSLKALIFANKLKNSDPYFGAKAEAALMPEGSDLVGFWSKKQQDNPGISEYFVELGKAYLFNDDPVSAELSYNKAIEANASYNRLLLNIARFHMMKVMRDKDQAETELPEAMKYLEKYLNSKPEPVIPLRAYTMGLQAMFEKFQGNQEEGNKKLEEAKTLDPYFSRASGIPTLLLFDPPDKISHQYFSFFSPF